MILIWHSHILSYTEQVCFFILYILNHTYEQIWSETTWWDDSQRLNQNAYDCNSLNQMTSRNTFRGKGYSWYQTLRQSSGCNQALKSYLNDKDWWYRRSDGVYKKWEMSLLMNLKGES